MFTIEKSARFSAFQAKVTETLEPGHGKCDFQFFYWYIKFGYYLFLIPFYPVFNNDKGHYELHLCGQIRKIICFIGWTLATMFAITKVRTAMTLVGLPRTVYYFYAPHNLARIGVYMVFWQTLLTKVPQFETLIHLISHSKLLHPRPKWTKGFEIATTFIWISIALSHPFFGSEMFDSSQWTLSNLYRNYVSAGRYTFLFQGTSMNITTFVYPLPEMESITTFDTILACLEFFALLGYSLNASFVVMSSGLAALVVYVGTENFLRIVYTYPHQDTEKKVTNSQVSQAENLAFNFHQLRRLIDALNGVWLDTYLWIMLYGTLWMATELDYALKTHDWFFRFQTAYMIGYIVVSVVVSADCYRRISVFNEWLLSPNKEGQFIWKSIPERQMVQLLVQQVSGSCITGGQVGLFQVNGSFIAKALSVLTTYFMISLQDSEKCNF